MTIRDALRSASERLERHQTSNSRLTAELLLAHCLSVAREYLYAHDDRVLSAAELQALEDVLDARISGVPLQYIVGRQEFYGRYFQVNPSVLIPRPETEHIIEAVLETSPTSPVILDVGTGSGCIAVTLALEIPSATVFATDISENAARVARNNAANLGAHVAIACLDVIDAIRGKFDFIVSNPPYVLRDDISRLQREVLDHEPHLALFAPPQDEVAIYRKLVAGAGQMLNPGGYLVMEVGIGMDQRVMGLFGPAWTNLSVKPDLQGIPRTVIAQKS